MTDSQYTSNNRLWVSSHGAIDIRDSDKWWNNMIELPYNVTITKYVPFGECYEYDYDTIVNEKDEYAICNYLKPGKGSDHNHEKVKYYGRKGNSFPEVYFSADDDGNFNSSVAICNDDGTWTTLYNIDDSGEIKLSQVIDLVNTHLNGDTFDIHILTCLSYIDESEEDEEDEEEDYDDRQFQCRSCHRAITLWEDRWWNKGYQESICQNCWQDVPGRFKQYYIHIPSDNHYCMYYNSDKGCKFGDNCIYKHVKNE